MSAHALHRVRCCASSPGIPRTRHTSPSRDLILPKTKLFRSRVDPPPLTLLQGSTLGARERALGWRSRACGATGARAGPHSLLARRGRSRRAAICARRGMVARRATTSPGLRRPSLGDDVAAWLLSNGAVSEAAIATATLPPPRFTTPRRAGEGAPGGGHYRDVTGRCGAGAAAPRVGYGSDRRGAGRAAPRLRRHMRCLPRGSHGGQRAVAQSARGRTCAAAPWPRHGFRDRLVTISGRHRRCWRYRWPREW